MRKTAQNCGSTEVLAQYPWLSKNESCDVLVLGGGIAGCLCAYELSSQGVDVVLLSDLPIGYNACGASSSICGSVGDLMLSELSASIGKENAVSCFFECEKALSRLEELSEELDDFSFSHRDSFIYTDSAEDVNRLYSEYLMRKHNGFNVEFLEQAESCEMFSFPVKAGLLMRDAACELDGYKLCHALIKKALENGARVYENSAAVDLVEMRSGIVAKTKLNKTVNASKLLLAIGKEQDKYLSFLPIKKRAFFLSTSTLDSFSGYESRAIIKNISKNIQLRATHDDRIVMSGLSSGSFENESRLYGIIGGERLENKKYTELSRLLEVMLCGAGPLKGEHCFSMVYTATKDGLPIFGKPMDYSNVYFCSLCSLDGILFGVIGAQKLCELHKEQRTCSLFSPDRKTL